MTTYRTAIYCRKSSEDEDSIQIQEDFVKGYIADKREFELHKTYADNGYTGVNFDRPAWKEMMQDIKYGIVQCIIVKDLSRLGRNYIEVNEYLERTFPTKGIRVIAITDRYDSLNANGLEIETAFMNLLNSHMAAETSYKIHQTLDGKMKRGEVISRPPYGYVKSGKGMAIDPEKAAVVRKIFNWVIDGEFISDIIRKLKLEEIPSPTGSEEWSYRSVTRILKDRTYLGEYHTGTRRRELYKQVEVQKEDIQVFQDHHEAIVTETEFGIVQYALEIRSNRRKTNMTGESDSDQLKGLAKCAICGKSLSYLRKNSNTRVATTKYYCKHHTGANPKGVKLTKRPEIESGKLKEEIVRQYNAYIDHISDKDDPNAYGKRRLMVRKIQDTIARNEGMVSQYRKQLIDLYEQYVNQIITQDEFICEKEELRKKREDAEEQIKEYKSQLLNLERSETMRKEVLLTNKRLESFDEDAIRRAVTEILLDADGNVQVRFKIAPDIDTTKSCGLIGGLG